MSNSLKLEFDGFDQMLKALKELEVDVKETCEEALVESKMYITKELEEAMIPHNRTGQTLESLNRERKVYWQGETGYIDVGFNITEGGLASVFLMYGTPKMQPDKKLYNAIYGSTTKKKVKQLQENVVYDAWNKAVK